MAKNVKINNVVYDSVPIMRAPKESGSGFELFYDTSDATAQATNVLTGKTSYGADGKINGSMPENGDTSGTISTKEGTVTIPEGHTSGGTVGLSAARKSSIVSSNIKSGRSILGVSGSSMVVDTTVSSGGASASDILSGKKAYVNGVLINGEASAPTVSQDSTTKVLTIS